MTIKEMRTETGLTQTAFGELLGIPMRTIQDWEKGLHKCPEYVRALIEYKLINEGLIGQSSVLADCILGDLVDKQKKQGS